VVEVGTWCLGGPNPSIRYSPDRVERPGHTPRLIPDGVYEYAERLKQKTLSEAQFPSSAYAPDDPKMVPYLEAVAAGDEPTALQTLAGLLATSPLLLWHPYTQSTVSHLFMLFGQFADQPKAFRDQVNTALNDFVSGWGYGVTGRDVRIRTNYTKRGQTPALFPSLDDRDGAFLRPEAVEQRHTAWRFVEFVDALKSRMRSTVRWREFRSRYRDSGSAGKNTVIGDLAGTLRGVFAVVLHEWSPTTELPSVEQAREIAQKSLTVRRGHPNDMAAYQFVALYPFVIGGSTLSLTPSLIKNTLRTLAKRGIPPPNLGRARRPKS
jgi:hypothetical protein